MSDKVRVHEIAKELGIVSKEVVDKALEMGLNVKTASSSVSMEDAENIMNFIMGATAAPTPKPSKPLIKKAAAKKEEPKLEEATEEKPAAPEKESPSVTVEASKSEPKEDVKPLPEKEKSTAEVKEESAMKKEAVSENMTQPL